MELIDEVRATYDLAWRVLTDAFARYGIEIDQAGLTGKIGFVVWGEVLREVVALNDKIAAEEEAREGGSNAA